MAVNRASRPPSSSGDRKQEEVDFHNQREVDRRNLSGAEFEAKYANKKWYAVARQSHDFSDRWLHSNCRGKVALDYCCGLGSMSLRMVQYGAFVHGIDISGESVRTAKELMTENGLGSRVRLQVMDAEKLTFENDMFDVIICSGVLHHLDLDQAYPQLARVLKPSGKILCMEAVGHNPIIQGYRKLTPHLRTTWEAEHILKRKDVRKASRYFDRVDVRFFHLCSIAAAPLRKTPLFRPVLSIGEMADSVLLKIPGFRWMAWQMVFELSMPKKLQESRNTKVA